MGFKMNCDRCGRFIKNVSITELKDVTKYGKEVLCLPCQKWEANAKARVEKAIDKMKGRLEKYRVTFVEEIQKICEMSKVKEEEVKEE